MKKLFEDAMILRSTVWKKKSCNCQKFGVVIKG